MHRKQCILLVEDEQDTMQTMLNSLLTKRHDQYEPLVAIDGYEALDFLFNKQIDLVVLDLNMSNLNGIEVCQHKFNDKDLRHIPVIISSAFLDPSMEVQLRSLGIQHFLKKPYKMEVLLAKIDELMGCPA
ncbi:MAG TPA: response regulator [Candidatus Omnitrophota bacterium]|nr:response regulator [Candidatus Omnitrophota bacterium]